MNITPHTASIPLATVVNPPTESLRRANHQKDIITQVVATNPSAAEKSVASEKERARTPAQVNEQVDFANLKKQIEHEASAITEQEHQHDKHQQGEQEGRSHAEDKSASQEAVANETQHEEELETRIVSELQARDKEVRAHEMAHAATGGSTTGAPSYTFEVGPDGKRYAVSGEVSVDLSPVAGDPRATITKMQKVHAAALAPVNPSIQDTKVAASATQKILEAQSEILSQEKIESDQRAENIKSALKNNSPSETSNDFDTLINKTLQDQEINSSASAGQGINSEINVQTTEVQQRSKRIKNFYSDISQGYERPDTYQFKLTA